LHRVDVLKKWLQWNKWLAGVCGLTLGVSAALADYSRHPQAQGFIDDMVTRHGFKREEVVQWLAQAQRQQSILDAIARPAEQAKPWKDYRKIFITPDRVRQGVLFWRQNKPALERAEREFGVSPAIIVAILGVETRYGRHAGGYRVLDALATLGFDYPPRATFFRNQLAEFLLMAREQKLQPERLLGSYAGAMGYGQFMPSSYRQYAVDFDGDGVADIINDVNDAIGSIANYLKGHGWQHDGPILARAAVRQTPPDAWLKDSLEPRTSLAEYGKLGVTTAATLPPATAAALFKLDGESGAEYWLAFNNFYVITRYNRSHMYSMAVLQLSEEVAAQCRQP
jgi:membrane-bound lytic murein transglycosylase B